MLPATTRWILAPLLLIAFGAGPVVVPDAAHAAGVSATVKVGNTLRVRSAPSLTAKVVGTVKNNQKVTVVCAITGQKVRGSVRTTTAWDRLSTGRYISHAYVKTSRSIPRCTTQPASVTSSRTTPAPSKKYVVGTVRSLDGAVNLRASATTSATRKGSVGNGTKLNLVCRIAGTRVAGTVRTTNQWNRTSAGTYIAHAYMYSGPLPVCVRSSTPAPSVTLTPEQFIKNSVPGAQRGWREYGVPPSVTIAQAILESGWGRSSLSTVDRNYFGIKCQNGKYGTLANGCHTYRTQECTKAGKCFYISDAFRTYATQSNSFRDHGQFLRVNSRYKPAFAYTKNANNFIWNVWKAGYATDPNYYTKITGIMAKYKLYQYDTWK
jgi:hypothetical protein